MYNLLAWDGIILQLGFFVSSDGATYLIPGRFFCFILLVDWTFDSYPSTQLDKEISNTACGRPHRSVPEQHHQQQQLWFAGLGTLSDCPYFTDIAVGWHFCAWLVFIAYCGHFLHNILAHPTHCRVGSWHTLTGLWVSLIAGIRLLANITHGQVFINRLVWILELQQHLQLQFWWTVLQSVHLISDCDNSHCLWGQTALAYTVYCACAQVDWSTQFCHPTKVLAAARKTIAFQAFCHGLLLIAKALPPLPIILSGPSII